MRLFLTVSLITIISPIFAQTGADILRPSGATNGTLAIPLGSINQADGNILGDPFRGQDFKVSDNMGDVSGTPYLYNDWKSGEVILKNDERYGIQKINFDASRNEFIYVQGDSIFEFSDNVREVRIYSDDHNNKSDNDMVFRTDINPSAANYVEVLTKGKVIIFCEYIKNPEGENYSNGIVNNTRKYVLHANYYSIINNKENPLTFGSSALEELTSDKKEMLSAYIKNQGLKIKKEPDFIKAIDYYNSLN